MPVSNRKRQANRENAAKSTGPKTEEGKKNSSRNATTHGLFCANIVLDGEDLQTFELLRDQLISQLQPQNLMERIIVERIVSATWKLERLQRAERVEHGHQAAEVVGRTRWKACRIKGNFTIRDQVREQIEAENDNGVNCYQSTLLENETKVPAATTLAISFGYRYGALERLARYEQQLERSIYRALRELRELRKPLKDAPELHPSPYGSATVENVVENVESDSDKSEVESLAPSRDCGASVREGTSAGAGIIDRDNSLSIARANDENEATDPMDEAQVPLEQEVAGECAVELIEPHRMKDARAAEADAPERRADPNDGMKEA